MKKLLLHCSIAPLLKRKQSNNETMKQFARGFTLIELMVSMAILAILAGGIIAALNPVAQFQKSRDAHRKSDLVAIQKALELYYQDHDSYPASNANFQILSTDDVTPIDWGDPFLPYMTTLPVDPDAPTRRYVYVAQQDGQAYWIFSSLERGSLDQNACNPNNAPCTGLVANAPANTFCGTSDQQPCTFGVSSPNVSVNIAIASSGAPPGGSIPPGASPTPTPGFPASTDLVAYWKMDELSNGGAAVTRKDKVGASNLTDNNTTPSATGRVGVASADVEADTFEHLTVNNNPGLSLGDINFTVAAWVNLESLGADRVIVAKSSSSANREYVLQYNNADNKFQFVVYNSAGSVVGIVNSNITPVVATWYLVVAWHNATGNSVNIQVNNGNIKSAGTGSGAPSVTSADFFVGAQKTASGTVDSYFDGKIDEVAIWKDVLTVQERADLYNGGQGTSYVPPTPTFPVNGLVAYWKMDERKDTIPIIDSFDTHPGIPHGINPTIAKIDYGRSFSSGTYAQVAYTSDLDVTEFTISMWVKASGQGWLFTKIPTTNDSGYGVRVDGAGRVYCSTGGSSGLVESNTDDNNPLTNPVFQGLPFDTAFHHIVVAKRGNPGVCTIYIDGTSRNKTVSSHTVTANNTGIRMGTDWSVNPTSYFVGTLDEVGLWNWGFLGSDVNPLYNDGGGNTYTPAAAPTPVPGVYAHWKMNEGSWIPPADQVIDSSGNVYNGQAFGGATTNTSGIYGNAGSFDGSNDYITIPSAFRVASQVGSVSVWVYPQQYNADVVSAGVGLNDFRIGLLATGDSFYGFFIGQEFRVRTPNKPVLNVWSHVTLTWDSSSTKLYINGVEQGSYSPGPAMFSQTGLTIGRISWNGNYFKGYIDDLRFYNRALSAPEILAVINAADDNAAPYSPAPTLASLTQGLIGYWQFDEGITWNGTTGEVRDTSGNNNNGTSYGGAVNNAGKIGKAADFINGTTQYIDVPDSASLNPSDLSISMWLQLNADPNCDTNNNWRSILSKGPGVAGVFFGYDVVLEDNRQLTFDIGYGTASERWLFISGFNLPIDSSTWTHVVFTHNGATGRQEMYIGGSLINSRTATNKTIVTSTNTLTLTHTGTSCPSGRGGFDGKFDDLRIYNRVLTQQEVSALAAM